MKIDNDLTRMLGIEYPIIQGAYAWEGYGTSKIAVPVSEAGGLGIITAIAFKTAEDFREDIKKAMSLTDKPLAVNYSVLYGTEFTHEYYSEYVKAAIEEGIKIVFTSSYDGTPIGKEVKKAGCTWIHKCATLKHAVSIAGKGVDALAIVGVEGAGNKTNEQTTTLINITNARKMITDIPLIAVGGIADAYGFAAALAMGASGVYMGTAFMATKEFQGPDDLLNPIINQSMTDPAYTTRALTTDPGVFHSQAAGVIDSVPDVKEFIESLVKGAKNRFEEIKGWGLTD